MPLDAKGNKLQVGDLVLVPARISHIHRGDDYCNANLESYYKMFPTKHKTGLSVNTQQCIKISSEDLISLTGEPSLDETSS